MEIMVAFLPSYHPVLCQTTLSIAFNRYPALIQYPVSRLSSKDLAEITDLPQDRKRWRGLTSQIEKADDEL